MPGACGSSRRWPLHPQPTEWENLQTWVSRIAETYGVSYDTFLFKALGHSGRGARDLNLAPDGVIAALSAGTGISIERLQDMTTSRLMVRLVSRAREVLETPQGQTILDDLNATATRNQDHVSPGQAVRGI